MSSYNESIKHILYEVQLFMNETLKGEKVSDKVKKHKSKILELILKLQDEYSALKPDTKDDVTLKVPADEDESVFTGGSGNSEEETAYSEKIRDMPVASLTHSLKNGYLDKRRKGLMGKLTYQRRYCIINTAVLYYFEKPTDKKQRGAFHLNGYEFRPAPILVRDTSKKELSFELVAPGKRSYEFLAENKEEFDAWKDAVESCHNEPISDEIYEAIEDVAHPPPYPGDGEEYEAPVIDTGIQEVYQEVNDETPPQIPDARKMSTPSVPRSPPPPVPNIHEAPPPIPPSIQRRDLPAVPTVPLPPTPKESKLVSKLDIPDIDPSEDYENMYYGKWNCSADTDDELMFNKGDIIHVISKDFDKDNWWVGELKGSVGLVPKAYLAKAFELVR